MGDHHLKPRRRFRGLRLKIDRRWVRFVLSGIGAVVIIAAAVLTYYYISFSRMIDARLHGERERALPRVFARPVELRRGQTVTELELIARLNDLGYTHRARVEQPGEFAIGRNAIALTPRAGDLEGRVVRVEFNPPARVKPGAKGPPPVATGIRLLEVRPALPILFLIVLLVGLSFGGRAAANPEFGKVYAGALTIFLILFGLGVSPLPADTPDSFSTRIAYVLFAILYTIGLAALLWPRAEPARPAAVRRDPGSCTRLVPTRGTLQSRRASL